MFYYIRIPQDVPSPGVQNLYALLDLLWLRKHGHKRYIHDYCSMNLMMKGWSQTILHKHDRYTVMFYL
jgi:hypothetical protein